MYTQNILNLYPKTTSWENLTIEISGGDLKNNITISNVYRPPRSGDTNAVLRSFIAEFTQYIDKLSIIKRSCCVAGDMNINLLKINERPAFNEYFDMMVGLSFIPKITQPTRFSQKSCTLIDQIFTNESVYENTLPSGILIGKLSDHLACLTSLGSTNHNANKKKVAI